MPLIAGFGVLIHTKSRRTSLIKRSYDIDYHVEDEGENQIKVSISAEKADSAFMLLPYYRKKLKFDNIKNVWIIK